ncbi:MAG TPA: hypothetical protein VFE42_14435, partial [Chloroflexota bacterium]|nr:hypothetical protein [Chloroflexota bacterium]
GRYVGNVEDLPAAIGEVLERGGTSWPAPQHGWASATQRVVDGMAAVAGAPRLEETALQVAASVSQSGA